MGHVVGTRTIYELFLPKLEYMGQGEHWPGYSVSLAKLL